jgi:hypothetical protein
MLDDAKTLKKVQSLLHGFLRPPVPPIPASPIPAYCVGLEYLTGSWICEALGQKSRKTMLRMNKMMHDLQ